MKTSEVTGIPSPGERGVSGTLGVLVGTFLGAGFFPVAPGTAGTLGGIPLAWLSGMAWPWLGLVLALLLFFPGWWAAGVCERRFGRKDPPAVVIDEVVGLLVALAGIAPGWLELLLGFTLFRLFDILKPWPVRLVDRKVPGGLGIMLDDVIAGLFARAALEVILLIFFPAV